jgi:hypothetical protein
MTADGREPDRQARLRDALRENLKRRKSQLRGRAGQAGTAPAASDPDSSPQSIEDPQNES